MAQEPPAMAEGRKAHLPQAFERKSAKVAFAVPAPKDAREDLLCQPTVQLSQLLLIIDVFQIVVEYRNRPNAAPDDLLSGGN